MARSAFGGGGNDFTFDVFTFAGKQLLELEPATLTLWSAQTGGTQYTDLLLAGAPVTSITVGSNGQIPVFQGPDGILFMWADAGSTRIRLVALEGLAAQVAAHAAAVLAVPATTDGLMTTTDANAASAFRVQQDARLTAAFQAFVAGARVRSTRASTPLGATQVVA